MLAAIILAALAAVASQDVDDSKTDVPPDIERLVAAHNRIRSEHDLPSLRIDPKLMDAAKAHAKDMAEHSELSHRGTDGSTPSQRVERRGYHYLSTGENVAVGQESVDEVMSGWMDSPPHRRNILGDFTEIGAARAEDDEGRPYWAVDFGRPIPRLDPEEAASEVVRRINDRRKQADLAALEPSPKLMDAARATAQEMAERDTIRRSDGGNSAFERVRREDYPFREISQSNASGEADPEALVKTLADSEDAERGLLGDHREVGVGYARANDGTPYWVVLFATRR